MSSSHVPKYNISGREDQVRAGLAQLCHNSVLFQVPPLSVKVKYVFTATQNLNNDFIVVFNIGTDAEAGILISYHENTWHLLVDGQNFEHRHAPRPLQELVDIVIGAALEQEQDNIKTSGDPTGDWNVF